MPRTRRKQQNQEEGRHLVEDEDEQSTHAQGNQPEETHANTRTNVFRSTGLSYRRPNCDYRASMKWTYEMNKDLYRMYIKADKKRRGYQKRLKTLWDKDYPRETHVNEKQLAQQIRNIEQKQFLPEIELKRIEQEMGGLNTPGEHNLGETNLIQNRVNNNEQNTNNETSDETFGIDLDTDIELDLTPGDVNNRPDNIEQQQNSMDIDTDEQSIIYREDLREIWRKNFEKYINMDIEHREFSTKVTPLPTQKKT